MRIISPLGGAVVEEGAATEVDLVILLTTTRRGCWSGASHGGRRGRLSGSCC